MDERPGHANIGVGVEWVTKIRGGGDGGFGVWGDEVGWIP